MKHKRSSIPLILCLLASCGGQKVAVNPTSGPGVAQQQALEQVKAVTSTLAVALDEGIALEQALAAQGAIEPQLEPQIRQWLKDGKVSVDAFNARVKGYVAFDATSKADILKFADDAVGLIAKLNDEGVLRIKNPDRRITAAGIIAGARVAVHILRDLVDRQVVRAPPVQ